MLVKLAVAVSTGGRLIRVLNAERRVSDDRNLCRTSFVDTVSREL